MTGFTEQLVEANRDLWAAMAGHPLVLALAEGTLPDSALQAWVQQDRVFVVEERRVLAALRAHGLPSRLDDLLADMDRGLVLEADAFTRTAADHGVAAKVEPWPLCLGYSSYLRCAAFDGALEGLTALRWLAGRSALPLDPGTVDTVACHQAPRGKRQSQRSRPCGKPAELGRLGRRPGWWDACGSGSGMPAPSGRIPPSWARWENEAPATRAACSSFQA